MFTATMNMDSGNLMALRKEVLRKHKTHGNNRLKVRYRGGEVLYVAEIDDKTGKRTVLTDKRTSAERTRDLHDALRRMKKQR